MRFSWMILAAAYLFPSIQAQSAPPDCSLDCMMTIVPEVCGSLTNLTCLCTSAVVAAELTPCVSSACNITESLRLLKYQADTCGVAEDKSRINQQLQLYYVMPALTFLVVLIRVISRMVLDVGVKEDDYMMITAELFYLVDVATGLVMVLNGFGEHTYSLTIAEISISLKFFYICELFYILTITFTKLSLLLFFRRIFPNKQFILCVWITFGFVVASNFSLLMALTFQCTPFHGNWTNWMYKVAPVKCIDSYAAVFTAAGFSIFHDVVILILPLPLLWKLHLPWQKKANLLIMFTLGSFVVVCSAIRLPSLLKLQRSADPSYDQAPIAVWTNLEQSIGIICGCLPACRSLLGWLFPGMKMSLKGSSKDSSAYGLGYSKHSKTTSRPDRLDRDFIELDDNGSAEENNQRGRTGSVNSKESQIPFGETLVPNKGKNMGHRTYVNVREKSLDKSRAPAREKSNHSLRGSESGIILTRSVLMTEQRSGPQR